TAPIAALPPGREASLEDTILLDTASPFADPPVAPAAPPAPRSKRPTPAISAHAAAAAESVAKLLADPRFVPLLQAFVASLSRSIGEIRAAREAGATASLTGIVHRLKGTAANYGMPAITDAAARAVEAIREEKP